MVVFVDVPTIFVSSLAMTMDDFPFSWPPSLAPSLTHGCVFCFREAHHRHGRNVRSRCFHRGRDLRNLPCYLRQGRGCIVPKNLSSVPAYYRLSVLLATEIAVDLFVMVLNVY